MEGKGKGKAKGEKKKERYIDLNIQVMKQGVLDQTRGQLGTRMEFVPALAAAYLYAKYKSNGGKKEKQKRKGKVKKDT